MSQNAQLSSGMKHPALQGHVAFFDTDNDDIIWPTDTFKGFRAIGFGVFFSLLSMIIIHSGFSYLTFGTLLPDPCFRLRVSRINRAIHGSDTGIYTQTGELDESRFDFVFALYSAAPHAHLSFSEGVALVRGNRNPFDVFGWIAAVFEWGSVFLLLAQDGQVKREDVHDIMNGTLFPRLAAENEAKKKHEAQMRAELDGDEDDENEDTQYTKVKED
ncbi:hypothetical protein MVEN_01101300 [Mycena venus]|uniref:Caleosin-domain-containing protein n=1 Tax=Mycena venus TaxID=2733690 RepID=A0A8H6Y977_9AGAR|nr:hypothetical protein MVEN_01101300 [Mycena venus]